MATMTRTLSIGRLCRTVLSKSFVRNVPVRSCSYFPIDDNLYGLTDEQKQVSCRETNHWNMLPLDTLTWTCSFLHFADIILSIWFFRGELLQEEGMKHWALRPQKPLRLIRDGEVGGSGNLKSNTYSLHCRHQNDSALRWAVVWAILMFH